MPLDSKPSLGNSLGGGLFKRLSLDEETVGPSVVNTVDSIELDRFVGATYIVTVWDESTGNLVKKLNMDIGKKNGQLVDSVYGKIGHPISIGLNAVEASGKMELRLTNNELYTLGIDVVRLVIPT